MSQDLVHEFHLTKDTPYLNLTGKIWGAYREYFGKIDHVITAPDCKFNMFSFLCFGMCKLLCVYSDNFAFFQYMQRELEELGQIYKVRIGHNDADPKKGWYLEEVS